MNDLKEFVYNYTTKYKEGFTRKELRKLLKELKISSKYFNQQHGVNTCMLIDGETINYHVDVYTTIVCCLQNRERTTLEFD